MPLDIALVLGGGIGDRISAKEETAESPVKPMTISELEIKLLKSCCRWELSRNSSLRWATYSPA